MLSKECYPDKQKAIRDKQIYRLEGVKQRLALPCLIGLPILITALLFSILYQWFLSEVSTFLRLTTLFAILALSGWFAFHMAKRIAVQKFTATIQEAAVTMQMQDFFTQKVWQFTFDQIKHYRVFRYNGTVVDIWLQNGQRIKITMNDTFNEERDLEPFIEHLTQGVAQYHPQAASTRKASFLEKPVALFAGGIVTVAYLVFAVLWMAKMITIDNSGSLLIAFSIILTYWLGVIRSRMDAEKDARSGY